MNIFAADFGMPDFNLHPMLIDDIAWPKKRSCNKYDHIPATISVSYKNSAKYLNQTCEYPPINLPSCDITSTDNTMIIDRYDNQKHNIVYCTRSHDWIICYYNLYYFSLHVIIIR